MSNGASDTQHIRRTLRNMFEELVEIKVVTAVGAVGVTLGQADTKGEGRTKTRVSTDSGEITDAMVTIIDLVDGDVTNVIAPALKDDEALRSFHAMQVEKSLTVLPGNIKALVELGQSLIDGLK
jgi:hypothetical protein